MTKDIWEGDEVMIGKTCAKETKNRNKQKME